MDTTGLCPRALTPHYCCFLILVIIGAMFATPVEAQKFSVTPSSIDFQNEVVGLQSSAQVVTVKNLGNTPLTVNSFSISPFAVFQLSYGFAPQTLAAGQGASFAIKFVPGMAQQFTGQISISIAGVSAPQVVPLSGMGILTQAKAMIGPLSLNFSNQPLGTTTSKKVTVKNIGTAPMTLTSLTAEPPFATSGYTSAVIINPKSSFSFQVSFTPT